MTQARLHLSSIWKRLRSIHQVIACNSEIITVLIIIIVTRETSHNGDILSRVSRLINNNYGLWPRNNSNESYTLVAPIAPVECAPRQSVTLYSSTLAKNQRRHRRRRRRRQAESGEQTAPIRSLASRSFSYVQLAGRERRDVLYARTHAHSRAPCE